MPEFVLIETRARGKKWCVVRGKSQQLLETIAERRRVNFPKTRQDVMTKSAWWNHQFYAAQRSRTVNDLAA